MYSPNNLRISRNHLEYEVLITFEVFITNKINNKPKLSLNKKKKT